jgi:hypothetical protein
MGLKEDLDAAIAAREEVAAKGVILDEKLAQLKEEKRQIGQELVPYDEAVEAAQAAYNLDQKAAAEMTITTADVAVVEVGTATESTEVTPSG